MGRISPLGLSISAVPKVLATLKADCGVAKLQLYSQLPRLKSVNGVNDSNSVLYP